MFPAITVGGQDGVAVGTCYIARRDADGRERLVELTADDQPPPDRAMVRTRAVRAALELLAAS